MYCFTESNFSLSMFTVYLNVTDLTTYKVGWDSFCIRWSAHRSATSYRLKLNPADGKYISFFAFYGNITVLFQWQNHLFGMVENLHQKLCCIWLSFKDLNHLWRWKICKEVLLIIKLTLSSGNFLVTRLFYMHTGM